MVDDLSRALPVCTALSRVPCLRQTLTELTFGLGGRRLESLTPLSTLVTPASKFSVSSAPELAVKESAQLSFEELLGAAAQLARVVERAYASQITCSSAALPSPHALKDGDVRPTLTHARALTHIDTQS